MLVRDARCAPALGATTSSPSPVASSHAPSPLLSRVKRSSHDAATNAFHATKKAAQGPALLVFDATSDILHAHPLVRAMGLAPSRAHAALVGLRAHEAKRGAMVDEDDAVATCDVGSRGDAGSKAAAPAGCVGCVECRATRLVVDRREGHIVCDDCGVVQTRAPINVQREYDGPTTDDERVRRDPFYVGRGVPRWLVAKTAATTQWSVRASSHVHDLEHWNAYARVSTDELAACDATLRTWQGGAFSREERVAAVLLWRVLSTPEEARVRECIRERTPLPLTDTSVPQARFACGGCGTMRHTAKDARFHCRRRR